MASGQIEFENRLRRLLRKHRAMSRGYTARMRPDGLIEARPRRSVNPISGRSVVIFLAAFVLFKGFLIASIGPAGYADRVALLESGTIVEQFGAFAMQADPLSDLAAQKLGPLLR